MSTFFGGWYMHAGYGPRATWQEKMRRSLAATEHYNPPLLVIDPIVARGFVDLGFDTKQKLIDWCAENAKLPAREYWDNQWVQTLVHPLAVAGVEPFATRLKAAPDELVQMFRAGGHQHRGHRRRDPGRLEDVRRLVSRESHGLGGRLALMRAAASVTPCVPGLSITPCSAPAPPDARATAAGAGSPCP